jgi:hypothetical protein
MSSSDCQPHTQMARCYGYFGFPWHAAWP